MTTQNNETAINKPIHRFRDGALCVSIWRNEFADIDTGEIRTFYTMDMKRGYKKDNKWQETTSINSDDALKISNLYMRAHNWVLDRKSSAKNMQRSTSPEPVQNIQEEQHPQELPAE